MARILYEHVVDIGVNLPWKNAHDSIGGHVKADSDTWFELGLIDLGSAANHVSGPTGGLDHDLVLGDFLKDLSHELTDALDVLQILFSPVKSLSLLLDLQLL